MLNGTANSKNTKDDNTTSVLVFFVNGKKVSKFLKIDTIKFLTFANETPI